MELYPAEVDRLGRLVEEWTLHDDRELEATFKNASDTTTFLAVAQRLRAKGYTAMPQEDKMNIITPQQVRFTLTGMSAIESYCRDDALEGKPFEAMTKQRAGEESNLDIDSYGVRMKVRRENPLEQTDPTVRDMLNNWSTQRKAFRILRRWTFVGKGVRFDLSMVRSTARTPKGDFLWQSRFQPSEKGQRDITKEPAFYEIEVELLRPESVPEEAEARGALVKSCVKDLIRGVGEVLRGIQKHHLLIRNKVAAKVLEGYKQLAKTDRFRGVAPITMVVQNMRKERVEREANIRDGYNVTDKADGLRMMAYTDERGELFMIDMSMNVYKTGLMKDSCANALLDGEYVTRDKEGNSIHQLMLFDCYIGSEKRDVTQLPFMGKDETRREGGRYGELMGWVEKWNSGDGATVLKGAGVTESTKILVSAKQFKFAAAGDLSIFQLCARTLDSAAASFYNTDGLILTPNLLPIPQKPGVKFAEQLKWKPAEDNSVDFLVEFDKDIDTRLDIVSTGVKPVTGETVQHKTMRLYVGSDLDPAYEDPRGTVLYEQPLPGASSGPGGPRGRFKREYKPVLFNPSELPDTMASVCYVEISTSASGEDYVTCENGDPIENKSIVEIRYEPGNPPGWRWVPMRVRYDKTERYQKGIIGRTLNKDEAAEGVWNSIHDPITPHMIRTGSDQPSAKELAEMSGAVAGVASGQVSKVYYERKGPKEDLQAVRGLRDFHRRYIKEDLLLRLGLRGGGKTFVDLACGQGGDLWSWIKWKAEFVYGTDIAGNGIRDPQDGAYRRYVNAVMKYGGYDNVTKMLFTIGSSARNLATGEAGATPEESNIMRAVLGKVAPEGPIPPFVEKYAKGRLRNGADCVAIMFAIHYFFETEASLTGFMRNVSDSLAVGGLFVGCCFDGQKVFDALRAIPEGGSLVGQEKGSEIWKLTKRYSATELTTGSDSVGLAVDVDFVSIGTTQREYLVPFEMLKAKMAEIGCELLTREECRELGLVNSSELFEDTHDAAARKGQKFPMSPTVRQYSFFNRWFIFKRRRGGMMGSEEEEEEVSEEGPSRPEATGEAARPLTPEEVAEQKANVVGAAASSLMASPVPPVPGQWRKYVTEHIVDVKKDIDQEIASGEKVDEEGHLMFVDAKSEGGNGQKDGDDGHPRYKPYEAEYIKGVIRDYIRARQPPAPAAVAAAALRGQKKPSAAAAAPVAAAPPAPPSVGKAAAAAAKQPLSTIPVVAQKGQRRKYTLSELFQFYNEASTSDKLKLGDPDAARWLSPSSHFPIRDLETGTEYPSVEHYLAGMKYKMATNKPELAAQLFGREGEIHQEALRQRATESAQGARALTAEREHELLKTERKKVLEESDVGAKGMKKYRAAFEEGKWFSVKDGVLREALRQRWEGDERLRRIITAVKAKGLVLLYYTGPGSGSDLGGKRTAEGYIDGENKVGRILMELAGWRDQ